MKDARQVLKGELERYKSYQGGIEIRIENGIGKDYVRINHTKVELKLKWLK